MLVNLINWLLIKLQFKQNYWETWRDITVAKSGKFRE